MVHHAKEIKHAQSKFLVEVMSNVEIKLMLQHTSMSNIHVHKVTFPPRSWKTKPIRTFLFLAHTMCTDSTPIRNTLYGFIVSPGYPHPMGDNLKCSINIGRRKSFVLVNSLLSRCRSRSIDVY